MKFGLRAGVFSMGDKFTTAFRYPRQVALPADTVMTMVQGPSIKIATRALGNGNDPYIAWRFECGALTFTGDDGNATPPSAGFAIDRPIGI